MRQRLREIDGRLRELHRIRDRGRDAFHGSSDLRTLDPEKLWGDLGNIEDLERFAVAVEEYLPS